MSSFYAAEYDHYPASGSQGVCLDSGAKTIYTPPKAQ